MVLQAMYWHSTFQFCIIASVVAAVVFVWPFTHDAFQHLDTQLEVPTRIGKHGSALHASLFQALNHLQGIELDRSARNYKHKLKQEQERIKRQETLEEARTRRPLQSAFQSSCDVSTVVGFGGLSVCKELQPFKHNEASTIQSCSPIAEGNFLSFRVCVEDSGSEFALGRVVGSLEHRYRLARWELQLGAKGVVIDATESDNGMLSWMALREGHTVVVVTSSARFADLTARSVILNGVQSRLTVYRQSIGDVCDDLGE
jgi:ribosome-associated translation inhibitor RaiA